MKETINITQAGRKLFQIHNKSLSTSSPEKNTCAQSSTKTAYGILPSLQLHSSRPQNYPLYFRLDQLYKANRVIESVKRSFNESMVVLEKEMLKDLGYNNVYTNKKAQELASKLMNKTQKPADKVSINMEISKNRNYLTRINHLHCEQNYKYGRLKQSLEKTLNKQNTE